MNEARVSKSCRLVLDVMAKTLCDIFQPMPMPFWMDVSMVLDTL